MGWGSEHAPFTWGIDGIAATGSCVVFYIPGRPNTFELRLLSREPIFDPADGSPDLATLTLICAAHGVQPTGSIATHAESLFHKGGHG